MTMKQLVMAVMALGVAAWCAAPLGWAADEPDTSQVMIDTTITETSTSQADEVGVAWEDLPETAASEQAAPSDPAATAESQPADGQDLAAAPVVGAGGGAGLISVDFKDADIRQVLRIISLKAGIDVVAGTDVEGLVTIKLTNVPWEQALSIILRTYGFTYEKDEHIVRVMTLEALEQEALVTKVFPLDYARAKEVPDIVNEMLSDRGRIKFDDRTNTVIVTDIPTVLFQVEEVIARLDQKTPQVLIETKIVETKLEKDENLGIRWVDSFTLDQLTQSVYQTTFPFASGSSFGEIGDRYLANPVPKASTITMGTLTTSAFDITMNFLRQRANTHIVSNPTLAVLDNKEAKIHIGVDFPVPQFSIDPSTGNSTVSGFETKLTGTVLTVTPHVNPSREIVVELKPEIITVLSNASFANGASGENIELPRFSTQTVQTQVRVKDGETIAIGGLVKESELVQENRVAFLGDIPIIGALFRNTHRFGGSTDPTLKQDLMVFLTVTLMDKDAGAATVASAASEP